MSRTRQLSDLRADVCLRADIVDGATGGRHPSTEINRYINQAIQRFRRLVTDCGNPYYRALSLATTSTDSTPDANNWAPRDYLALPTDFYHLIGIDITTNGTTVNMMPYAELERNMFKFAPAWLASGGVGMPVFFSLGGQNAAGARIVKIIPSASNAYPVQMWYLPIATDLVNDTDLFDGVAGYEDWVVNRAAMDALLRDNNPGRYQLLAAENAALQQKMTLEFANTDGPGRRLDSKAIRQRLMWLSRGDWRVA